MVSLWKTSRSGFGERHLTEGYAIEDFPSEEELADGCAYFAKDRWIAESFAGRRHYETWLIEVRIELDEYNTLFRGFEEPYYSLRGVGLQVVIPRDQLPLLNAHSLRIRHDLQRPAQ